MKKPERKSKKKRDCKCFISATYSLSFLCGANGTRTRDLLRDRQKKITYKPLNRWYLWRFPHIRCGIFAGLLAQNKVAGSVSMLVLLLMV